jgi:hypothetical protein
MQIDCEKCGVNELDVQYAMCDECLIMGTEIISETFDTGSIPLRLIAGKNNPKSKRTANRESSKSRVYVCVVTLNREHRVLTKAGTI